MSSSWRVTLVVAGNFSLSSLYEAEGSSFLYLEGPKILERLIVRAVFTRKIVQLEYALFDLDNFLFFTRNEGLAVGQKKRASALNSCIFSQFLLSLE